MQNDNLKFKISGKVKIIIIIIIIFSVIVALVLPIAKAIFWTETGREVQFAVRQGESTREISQNLKKEKLIASAWIFDILIYSQHWLLQTGVYKITPEMHLIDIARAIRDGEVEEYLVTIPEGWRATQIDAILAEKSIIQKNEFLKIAGSSEGYLFPDTYRLPLKSSPEAIKDILLANFKRKTANLKISNQTIILASIVEREAKFDEDRPKIAGVYSNRLAQGMRLEADPTIQYGKGDWGSITKDDYKNFQSAYNTYLYTGLPPGPICNPGLESIKAVLAPEKSNNYYFFHQTDGRAVFSKTYQEHLDKLKKS